VFTRDKRWVKNEGKQEVRTRELQLMLVRCEITLFCLHGRTMRDDCEPPSSADWDDLEQCLVDKISADERDEIQDIVLYFLAQVVLTRLHCAYYVRKDWSLARYLQLVGSVIDLPAAEENGVLVLVPSSMQLVVRDLIYGFRDEPETIKIMDIVCRDVTFARPPISCHPDVRFRMMVYAASDSPESSRAKSKHCRISSASYDGLLAEYFMNLPGTWFEQQRLIKVLAQSALVDNPDLRRVLRRTDEASPWLTKAPAVCHPASSL
jgi:hypothetical protein